MKIIILSISILLLAGCKMSSSQKEHLIKTSEKFCSCHGGIEKMSFYMHLKEVLVSCNNGRWATFGLEDIVKKECK